MAVKTKKAPKKKPSSKKTTKTSTKWGELTFDPLAPSFRRNKGFQNAVEKRARLQYQPQLEALGRETGLENSRHSKRTAELGQWYGHADTRLQQAHQNTQTALNDLIAQRNAGSSAGQAALLAALNQSRTADQAQANTIGGVLPTNEALPAAVTAFGTDQAGANALGATFGGLSQESAGRVGVNAIGHTRAQEREQGITRNLLRELDEKRREVHQSIPGLIEEMRAAILKEEREGALQRIQSKLAGKELGETIRSNQANEGLTAAQIAADAAAASAGSAGDAAKAKTEALAKANEWLTGYIGGLAGTAEHPESAKANPEFVFRKLRWFGLNEKQALNLMLSEQGQIRSWAHRRQKYGKGFEKKSAGRPQSRKKAASGYANPKRPPYNPRSRSAAPKRKAPKRRKK